MCMYGVTFDIPPMSTNSRIAQSIPKTIQLEEPDIRTLPKHLFDLFPYISNIVFRWITQSKQLKNVVEVLRIVQ